jgi:hypothetical protein
MLYGVGVVQARFSDELLEVVCGLCGTLHARAACSLVDAVVVVGRGILATLFAPLLIGLGTMNGDTRRHFPIAARGRSKLGRFGASGVMGGDATPFFGGALGSIG